MKKILYLAIGFATISCSSAQKDLRTNQVQGVQIKVNIGDSTMQIFSSEDKNDFSPFLDVVSNSTAPQFKCGYTGEMTYYYGNIPNPILNPELTADQIMESIENSTSLEFNLSEDCYHIVYLDKEGELVSKKLTDEGREALLNLKNNFKRTPETLVLSNNPLHMENETPEQDALIEEGTPEKVPVDRTNLEFFWREYKQLIEFKDKDGLKAMFHPDAYAHIKNALLDEERDLILKSTFKDITKNESRSEHENTEVFSIMFEFLPSSEVLEEYPKAEGSANEYYIRKNNKGEFEIFDVLYAG